MPKDFEKCRANGGKIRTITGENKLFGLKKNQYMHVCILSGKVYRGEVKAKKEK